MKKFTLMLMAALVVGTTAMRVGAEEENAVAAATSDESTAAQTTPAEPTEPAAAEPPATETESK